MARRRLFWFNLILALSPPALAAGSVLASHFILGNSWFGSIFFIAFVLILFSPLAIISLMIVADMRKQESKRLRELKICRTCGYDMRATPQRCPECGTVVESAAP